MCKQQPGDLQFTYVDPLELIVPEDHPRTDHDDAPPETFDHPEHQLVHSVRQFGILQPILARQTPEGLEIISGRRRRTAAIAANLDRVPVLITTDDQDPITLNLAENIARKPLNPIDQANAMSHVGRDQSSRNFSIDPTLVSRSLNLLTLAPYIQDLVATGELSPAAANELHRADPEHRQALADRAVAKNLDAKQVFHEAPDYTNQAAAEREELKIHAQGLIKTLNDILQTDRARLMLGRRAANGAIIFNLHSPEETLCFSRRLGGETVPDPPARPPRAPRRRIAEDPYRKPKWTATWHDRNPRGPHNEYAAADFTALYLPDHAPRYGLDQAIDLQSRILPFPATDPRQRLPPQPLAPHSNF